MTDLVRDAATNAVRTLLGPEAGITVWERPRQRAWSWQFGFHVTGARGGSLLLKIPRWDEVPTLEAALAAGEQDSTHRELDGLRRIEAAVLASGDPGLTAIEPLGYVTAVNGILMRRLVGEALRSRLGWGGGGRDAEALFDRLGRWLKVFHGIDGQPQQLPFAAGVEMSRLDEVAARASAREGELSRSVEMLRSAVRALDGSTEPVADIHGDLNADNVLVASDARVAVIDPNRVRGPVLDDVARIIADVRLDRRQLVTAGAFRSDRVVNGWEQRLVTAAGYGDEPALRYRLALHAVERWAEVESELSGPTRAALLPGRVLLRRVVRRRLDALV